MTPTQWESINRQPRHAREEGYTLVRRLSPGLAVFEAPDGKREIWAANKGHPSYGFRYGGTDWEFVSSSI